MPRLTAPPTDESGTRVPLVIPLLVAAALFMEMLDATIVNTAVPSIAGSLGVPPLSVKAVLTSYTLSLAVFIPVSGYMADRYGTRRVFAWAVAVFTLGSVLSGASVGLPMLVAARVIQGIGGAMMTPVGRLTLVRTFPRDQIIGAMNYVIIPSLIGPLLGPLAGGLIVEWLPWRMIFLVNVPIGIVGFFLIRRYMPDYRGDSPTPLDRTGFVLFGAGIALLSYVLEVFGEHTWPPLPLAGMTLLSMVLLVAYWLHARGVVAPLLRLELFRIRTFRISVLGGFVTRLGIGGMPFLLPLLYQLGLGFAPWQAGLLMMPQAAAALVTKPFAQRVLERFGHRRVLMVNTLLLGATMNAFSLVSEGTPLGFVLALGFLQGSFSSLQFTAINSLVYADVSNRDASQASSLSSTGQQLSLSFGVAAASLVVALFLGDVPESNRTQLVGALHDAFHALGLLTLLSSGSFFMLRETDGDNVSHHHA